MNEFRQAAVRVSVAMLGGPLEPDAVKAFADRGYALTAYTDADLATTEAVIIVQRADKPLGVFHALQAHAKKILDHGCSIYVRVIDHPKLDMRALVVNSLRSLNLPSAGLTSPEQRTLSTAQEDRERVEHMPAVCVCRAAFSWGEIANWVFRNPAGNPPNLGLDIVATSNKGVSVALEPGKILLLQRAFFDCAKIELQEMVDGLSEARVYRVHAVLREGLLGKWPFLSFVKIGPRQRIETEFGRYQGVAISYIPFHLGPRLNFSRCCVGGEFGLLLGDFVKGAEPLRDAASGGRAGVAVAHLFNETLAAWRNAAKVEDLALLKSFPVPMRGSIPAHRAERIKNLGSRLTLPEAVALLEKLDSTPTLVGPVHGDLHATNVLVRGTDAIVIDFDRVTDGKALLFDLASLEGGLLVEGFGRDRRLNDPITLNQWLESVLTLYDCPCADLLNWRVRCHASDGSSWFHDCVRQIRMQAAQLQAQPKQYAAALGFCLLNKACNSHEFEEDAFETLRAAAYVLAERLLERANAPEGSSVNS